MSNHHDLKDKAHTCARAHTDAHSQRRGSKKAHALGLWRQSTQWRFRDLLYLVPSWKLKVYLLCISIDRRILVYLLLYLSPRNGFHMLHFSRQIRICINIRLPKITWVAPSQKNRNDLPESRTR